MNKEEFVDKFKELYNDLNLFSAINPNENANTKLLIDLLNIDEKNIKNFIDKFISKNINCELKAVYNTNNIDGLIEDKKEKDKQIAVIIENKIKNAEDQYRQIERYVGEVYCNNKEFLINIENEATNEIFNDIEKETSLNLNEEQENKFKELKKKEQGKELKSIIKHLKEEENDKQYYDLIQILENKIDSYEKKLKEKIKKKTENIKEDIKRENINVLYLVPDRKKVPSIYSYTPATEFFLNEGKDDRFKIITYDEIIEWMENLNVKPKQKILISSINLYSHYIYKYLNKDTKVENLINIYFSNIDNYKEYKKDGKIGDDIIDKEITKIKEEKLNVLGNHISDFFEHNKEWYLVSNHEKKKRTGRKEKEVMFRFVPKFEIKENNIYKNIGSYDGWKEYILAFEIKYFNDNLNLYLWLAPSNNKKLRKQILSKIQQKQEIKKDGNFTQIGHSISLLEEQDLLRLTTDALKEKFRDKILSLFEPNDIYIFKDLKETLESVYKNGEK